MNIPADPAAAAAAAAADEALCALLAWLKRQGYDFVTPTPSTHRLVRERTAARDEDLLRDIFGWVRPFRPAQVDPGLLRLMQEAQIVSFEDEGCRARLRVSALDGRLYLHSAPTPANDAVFLGPDSYRFAALIRRVLGSDAVFQRALDIGTGAGVGAMTLQGLAPAAEVYGSDINPEALRLAGVNARMAGLSLRPILASGLPSSPATFDIIVANPPYIAGDVGKTYRDGGEDHGAALGLAWARDSLARLTPGGRLVLYTGAPVVRGRDLVRHRLVELCADRGFDLAYEEIDVDVFGSTLNQGAYRDVERIAAVGAVVTAL